MWVSGEMELKAKITDIKSNITTLENTDHSLDSRISALENAGGGGSGSGSGSGALVFNSNTVQFTDEPMHAVRINDVSYKLYTGWIPFATKTKDGFKITMPNLTVNYTTANMG